MPRRRKIESGVNGPNLTPLLDVVLQLITFFMMLIHFGARLEGATDLVRLPVAPAALPGGDIGLDRLAAAIDARGQLLLESGVALDEPAAEAWWAAQAASRRKGQAILGAAPGEAAPGATLPTQVVLRIDRDTTFGAARRALLAAQEQGFASFSLVVLRRAR